MAGSVQLMKQQNYSLRRFILAALMAAFCLSFAAGVCAQTNYVRLRSFGFGQFSTGASPYSWLVEGSNAKLYGTTLDGGSNGLGVIFQVNKDGSGYHIVHHFTGATNDGASPYAGLLVGRDGALYGTASAGGASQIGVVFKFNVGGSGFQLMHSFAGYQGSDGSSPYGGLIQGQDSLLYGTARDGGTNGSGIVFKLGTNGLNYGIVYNFGATYTDGYSPYGGVIQGSDGRLYGTTYQGGSNYDGTVFRVNTNGGNYALLHNFDSSVQDGVNPQASLLQASDGMLYGTAVSGGTNYYGAIFKLDTSGGNYSLLHNFAITPDSFYPYGALIQGTNGLLYGTSAAGGSNGYGAIFEISTDAVTYAQLHGFFGPPAGGQHPYGSLFQASNGLLYGTSRDGGTNNNGTIFSLNGNGDAFTEFFSFNGNGGDANNPRSPVIQGRDGGLYGTTYLGGSNGLGTVFKMNADGSDYQLLHSFVNDGTDGINPTAGLLQADDGLLYGVTTSGGPNGDGAFFSLGTNGNSYTVTASFDGSQGAFPYGTLIQGRDGGLYGTAYALGSNSLGVVFRIDKSGSNLTALHSFPETPNDGYNPTAGLIQGADGGLYGATYYGGATTNGTVFRVSTNGAQYSVLHHFPENNTDGQSPDGALVQGPDGSLYGTTYYGGSNNYGAVFKLSTNGTGYTIIHHFSYGDDGGYPEAGLVWSGAGRLFGTTFNGGYYAGGTVFTLAPDGGNFAVLHQFPDGGIPGDGANVLSSVTLGNDGGIYGTTSQGGDAGYGLVFKLFGSVDIAGISYHAGTGAVVSLSGLPGQAFHLWGTTNLGNPAWPILGSNAVGSNGLSLFLDSAATNSRSK
jgi:uncharacterized repeat protein (TIGR03803 family)